MNKNKKKPRNKIKINYIFEITKITYFHHLSKTIYVFNIYPLVNRNKMSC